MDAILVERLRAQGNLHLEGLMDMIGVLLRKAWGENWGLFSDEEPSGPDPESQVLPRITWNYKRIYEPETRAIKPRLLGTEPDPHQPGQMFDVYSQRFSQEVYFKVWASTVKETRLLAGRFEELMLTYTGVFRQAGIIDLWFLEDAALSDNLVIRLGRQDIRARQLTYRVATERIWLIRQFTTQQIQTLLKQQPGAITETVQL